MASGLLASYFGKFVWGYGLIGAALGGSLLPLTLRRFVAPPLLRRHYKKYRQMQKPMSVRLTDSGIDFSTMDGGGLLKWKDAHGWRENNEYLLVYLAPKLYYLLPKRIANDGFPLEDLRISLMRHIGDAI